MRITDKDRSDIFQITHIIWTSPKRKHLCCSREQRRSFTAFLLRARRAGRDLNCQSIGAWCDEWYALGAMKAAA